VKKLIQSRVVMLVLGGLLGGIFGSGALWEWRKTGTEQAKYELDRITKIVDVRQKLEDNILKVLEIYKKNDSMTREDDPFKRQQLSREVEMEWKYKFPAIKGNIDQLESMLAKLENREPRNFDHFAPIPVILTIRR
jgi:hypothetical protein